MVTEGQDVQCTSYIRSVKCRLGFGNETSIKWREKLKSLPATIQKSFRQYQLPCSHFKTISQPNGISQTFKRCNLLSFYKINYCQTMSFNTRKIF